MTIAMKGDKIIASINAIRLPINVRITPSYPLPSNNNLCPGKTDSAVLASGAPKNIEGIVSKKVWVIAIEIINIDTISGDVIFKIVDDIPKTNNAIKFIWTPGINPVMIPKNIPKNMEINISKIIYFYILLIIKICSFYKS